VVVTGATGRIGSAVVAALRERGDSVVVVSCDSGRARERLGARVEAHAWREPVDEDPPRDALAGAYAVVHLLGEPVDQRWTRAAKRAIRESRVASTRNLVGARRALPESDAPAVLVSQSASGYYGARDGRPLDEHAPLGSGFLAEVVDEWERAAGEAAASMRVVVMRTGTVCPHAAGR
jgi:NAD dependent epimerase/dehydratase family enzyme